MAVVFVPPGARADEPEPDIAGPVAVEEPARADERPAAVAATTPDTRAVAINSDETAAPASPAAATAKSAPRVDDSLRKQGRGLLNLGASLTERGDFGAAEIAYWQILNDRAYAKQEQSDALFGLGRMYRRQGVFTKASAVFEKFLKLYPDDPRVPDALLDLGRSQRAMGAYKNAINRFYNVINSTLKLPPESYEHYQLLARTAQFEIAETHFETGNFAEAAKFFDRLRLLDLAPEDRARAHFKSACALLKGGEAEKAAGIFTQFIDQWPQDVNVPEARYLLALTLRQLGRAEDALTITLALLRSEYSTAGVDPKNWAYWQRRTGNQLANDFFQNGDTLSAVAIYDGLTHLSDNPSWRLPIIYQMGLCYERLRQSERANQAYRTIVEAVTQPTGKDPITGELTELARMAQWRIGQLDWNNRTDTQLDRFFSVNTLHPAPALPSAAAAPANDSHADSAEAPRSL
jgi:TolA-binding protein